MWFPKMLSDAYFFIVRILRKVIFGVWHRCICVSLSFDNDTASCSLELKVKRVRVRMLLFKEKYSTLIFTVGLEQSTDALDLSREASDNMPEIKHKEVEYLGMFEYKKEDEPLLIKTLIYGKFRIIYFFFNGTFPSTKAFCTFRYLKCQ